MNLFDASAIMDLFYHGESETLIAGCTRDLA
jgi:hypothetical protein